MNSGWRPAERGPEFRFGFVVVVKENVAASDELGQLLQTLADDPFAGSAASEKYGAGNVPEIASSSVVATQYGSDDLRIQNGNLTNARVSLENILGLLAVVGRFVNFDAVRRFPKIADLVVVFNLHQS